MDVSLYTVIPHDAGVEAMRQVLTQSTTYHGPPIEYTLELLTLTLQNNYFRFEDSWYLQVAGTSMGASMAPMYADAYMYIYEKEHILEKYQRNILAYYRFIDDLFIIWSGTCESAHEMVRELNLLSTPVRFTADISTEKVHYLDLEISLGATNLQYSLYTKPTDRNTLLHYQSAHPRALKNSLPKAQFLRVIRNN
ncbi:Hypothetical predicted protein [Pelobates cultripes]|uniref:Reverse transcriptase domain-containing protein n=1 Tax=Pelobates cultripes TaxID=61616 RepID=A0AAD1RSF7_PELCU|nr:Hypothetical predicted protein [Pelobates cultripes]